MLGSMVLHRRLQDGQVGDQIVNIVSEEGGNFRENFSLERLGHEADGLPQLGDLVIVRQRPGDLLERLADDFLLHRAVRHLELVDSVLQFLKEVTSN